MIGAPNDAAVYFYERVGSDSDWSMMPSWHDSIGPISGDSVAMGADRRALVSGLAVEGSVFLFQEDIRTPSPTPDPLSLTPGPTPDLLLVGACVSLVEFFQPLQYTYPTKPNFAYIYILGHVRPLVCLEIHTSLHLMGLDLTVKLLESLSCPLRLRILPFRYKSGLRTLTPHLCAPKQVCPLVLQLPMKACQQSRFPRQELGVLR